MKKFLFLLLFVPTVLFGQITIKSEKQVLLRLSQSNLEVDQYGYYLNMDSTLKWDENLMFYLGKTNATAAVSTNTLIRIYYDLNKDMIVASDIYGEDTQFSKDGYILRCKGLKQRGHCRISINELNTVLTYLQK